MNDLGNFTAFIFCFEADRKRSKRITLLRRFCVTREEAVTIRNQFDDANQHLCYQDIHYEWQPYPEKL